jgi:hypothetical protein
MHSTFTELYAVLCTRLAAGKYSWMKDGEDGQKQFKVHVASVLRSEFFSGFENFKKWVKEASAKTDFDANDYLIAYVKRKMKLLGNISFIAHLYNKSFLTLKVIKLVTFIMIQNVCENLYERNLEKNQEEQVYLEALIKLFDCSGKTIEEQEDKKIKKNKVYDGRVSDFLGHVDGLLKNPPTGPWKEESFYGDYPEAERNLWHVGKVGMQFLEQCLDYNIRPELSSLILNLFDKRRTGWKSTVYDLAGPKKLKELDDEYKRKQYQKTVNISSDEEDYYTRKRPQRGGGGHHVEDLSPDEYEEKKQPAQNQRRDDRGGRGYHGRSGAGQGDFQKKESPKKGYGGDKYTGGFGAGSDRRVGGQKTGFRHSENQFSKFGVTEEEVQPKLPKKMSENEDSMGFQQTSERAVDGNEISARKNSAKLDILKLLKDFLKEQKNCSELSVYKEWFEENKSDIQLQGAKFRQTLFEGFLASYADCHKAIGELRGTMIPMISNSINATISQDFCGPWSAYVAQAAQDGIFEDIPHLKVS